MNLIHRPNKTKSGPAKGGSRKRAEEPRLNSRVHRAMIAFGFRCAASGLYYDPLTRQTIDLIHPGWGLPGEQKK